MYKSPFALFFLAVLFLFAACTKNPQDTDDPVLTFTPTDEVQSVSTGNEVTFTISCLDDVSLATVEGVVICPMSELEETFEYPVLGQSLSFASGYMLDTDELFTEECSVTISCIDGEGNVSNSASFAINVVNGLDGSGPNIELQKVNDVELDSLENGIQLEVGSSFDIAGFVKDVPNEVEEFYITIENDEDYFDDIPFSFAVDTLVEIDNFLIIAPAFAGEFDLKFEARDGKNNLSRRSYPITVN